MIPPRTTIIPQGSAAKRYRQVSWFLLHHNVFSSTSTSNIAAIQTSRRRMQGLQLAQSTMHRHALGHSLRKLRCRRHPLRGPEPQETAVHMVHVALPIRLRSDASRNTDLLPPVAPEELVSGDDEGVGTSPRPARCRSTAAPTAGPSVPRRVQSPLRPLPRLPDPSDAAEDTSAYAETLEGAGGSKHGVPFYPGRHVLLGLLRTRTNPVQFR